MNSMVDISRKVPRICLNRQEAAMALGVSVNTLDQMVAAGDMPPPKRWHRRKMYLVAELENAAAELPCDGETEGVDGDQDEDWTAKA